MVQNCGAFSKNQCLSIIQSMWWQIQAKKKKFLEDHDSNIVLRSSNSNGTEELMVISYADLFKPLFLPRLWELLKSEVCSSHVSPGQPESRGSVNAQRDIIVTKTLIQNMGEFSGERKWQHLFCHNIWFAYSGEPDSDLAPVLNPESLHWRLSHPPNQNKALCI